MVGPEQVLILDPPAELHFQDYNDEKMANLKLTNPTDTRVCFRIRTTAPRSYCVKPNYGVIEPKKSITVNIKVYYFKATEQSKHKFMVQSRFAPDDLDLKTAVQRMEKILNETPAENLMTSKLICVFNPPESEVQALKIKKNVDIVRKHQLVISEAVSEVPEAVDTASEVEASMRSGVGADKVHVPNLWYHDLLSYLGDVDTPRASASVSSVLGALNKLFEEEEEHNDPKPVPQSQNGCTSTPHRSSRPQSETDNLLERLVSEIERRKQPHYSFGEHVAERLRALTPAQLPLCQKMISEVIFLAEMQCLSITSRVVTSEPAEAVALDL